jgi:uncharacterized protein YcaQ
VTRAAVAPRAVARADAARALLGHQLQRAPLADVVERLGTVQVDPLAPMGRSHDLVLQARVDGYRVDGWHGPAYAERRWLDGWDKQACLTLAEDWPARRLFFERFAERWRSFLEEHADAVGATLARLEHDGPSTTLGFDDAARDDLRGSWYGPRLVKHVLRALWDTGRVVTVGREAGRHVYDVAERGLPERARRAPVLSDADALDRLVRRRVQAAGALRVAADASTCTLPGGAAERRAALARAVREGTLEAWDVEGDAYVAGPGLLDRAPPVDDDVARVLAPLDALLWDRRGAADLFGFEYVWEVYKPASERRWGYYVVPVVVGERFVARFDGRLLGERLSVHGWWWEAGVDGRTPGVAAALEAGLARFLAYLGATSVALPTGLDRKIRSIWSAAVRGAPAWSRAREGVPA